MAIGYGLGTFAGAAAGIQFLEDLGLTVLPFPSPFNPWSSIYQVGTGATYGDGFPTVEWRFQWLNMSEMAILLGYITSTEQSTQVSVATKNELDVFGNYSAWMHRPTYPRQGDRRPGKYWRNVSFRFSQLESI